MKAVLTIMFLWSAVVFACRPCKACVTAGEDQKPRESASRAVDSKPTVDEVLDKYVQAIGGRTAVEKLSSRVLKGSVEVPATGETGSVEIYMKAPSKRLSIINIPSSGIDERGFDGTAGWYLDPDEGPQDMSAADLANMKLESDFYRPIRLKSLYPRLTLIAKEKVDNREAYVIEAVREDGTSERMYFDVQSGLLVRDDVPLDIPEEGKTTARIEYADYREVDSIKLPFLITQTSPDFDYIIRLQEIKHNVALDDAKFKKPKSQ